MVYVPTVIVSTLLLGAFTSYAAPVDTFEPQTLERRIVLHKLPAQEPDTDTAAARKYLAREIDGLEEYDARDFDGYDALEFDARDYFDGSDDLEARDFDDFEYDARDFDFEERDLAGAEIEIPERRSFKSFFKGVGNFFKGAVKTFL